MDISYRDRRLEKLGNDSRHAIRKLGDVQARRLRRRLDDLGAASNLEEMRRLPGRCHELTGNLAGVFSLDLEHPMRLLFIPQDDPPPTKPDGGLDWRAVEAVEILAIEDTHG